MSSRLPVVGKERDGKIERGRLLLGCERAVFPRSGRGMMDVENGRTCVGD